ncbi:MAG: hypothetical protein IRY99_11295 [Isosphaeraceae bacterium]|nr:hypothetical protein [Isosphaeraceae bacterium]
MNRRTRLWRGVVCLAMILAGCDDSPRPPISPTPGLSESELGPASDPALAPILPGEGQTAEGRKAIIESVVQLIQSAPLNPGGSNFDIATDRLNHLFAGTSAAEFTLSREDREFLQTKLPPEILQSLETREFTRRDARHIEDCMLYHAVATRGAGDGDDLTRARRLFDWIVRQIQLVPAGSLAPPVPPGQAPKPQAEARPYDVLLRGMATEQGGYWAERGWLFMALCRQIGIDTGLISYTPVGRQEPVVWITAALIDGKPYLFDARIGLPVPGPDGQGVATLEQAATDPQVLAQLDLPGGPYQTTAADLNNGRIEVLIDSTLGYLSPRMRAVQKELEAVSAQNRVTLFRDPAEQRAAFAKALGPRFGDVGLWRLPVEIELRLFTDPQFVDATLYPIRIFDARWPLLSARLMQLRGDLTSAIQSYVSFRFAEKALEADGKTPIPPHIQRDLDAYATYFLALAKLDQDDSSDPFLFKKTLELPEPGPGQPLYSMFRWGAQTNLALIHEARGDHTQAIRYFVRDDPTPQNHGNLLRACRLIWRDPFVPSEVEDRATTARR